MPPKLSKDEHFDAVSNALSRVLVPVMICMVLSVLFVHSLGDVSDCKRNKVRQLEEIELQQTITSPTSNSTESSTISAVIFIVIFIVLVVVLTFLMVWLYKSGHQLVIKIWLMAAVFLILAYVGGSYMFDLLRSYCLNIDWITLFVMVWNFAITGLFAVFSRVPRFINQLYLILISSLMAYIFRTLPAFAVWIILGLLVLWDLFAVLSPVGPLNLLVEAAREREDELPALVYDTNPVAAGREPASKSAKSSTLGKKKHKPTSLTKTNHLPMPSTTSNVPSVLKSSTDEASAAPIESVTSNTSSSPMGSKKLNKSTVVNLFRRNNKNRTGGTTDNGVVNTGSDDPTSTTRNATDIANVDNTNNNTNNNNQKSTAPESGDGEIQLGTLGSHIKLGLGDFVFYSILVAQASRSGPMSTIASFVAILTGLCATLFLVIIMRKALPALPISITAGLIVYFLTQYTLLPYAESLLPRLLFH